MSTNQTPPSLPPPPTNNQPPPIALARLEANYQRFIRGLAVGARRIHLLQGAVQREIERAHSATNTAITNATHLSPDRRRYVAARQWRIVLARDRLERALLRLVELQGTIRDITIRAKRVHDHDLKGVRRVQSDVEELSRLTRALFGRV